MKKLVRAYVGGPQNFGDAGARPLIIIMSIYIAQSRSLESCKCRTDLPFLSVRPSVRHIVVLCQNESTYHRTFSAIWSGIILVFFEPPLLKKEL